MTDMAASSGSRLFGILILGYPVPTVLILVNALALMNAPCPYFLKIQSTLVISKSEEPSKTLRDIHTSTYQICSIEEKQFEQPNFTNGYVI